MGEAKITEQEYIAIHTIKRNNPKYTQKQIAGIVARNVAAIGQVLSTDSFEEYKEKRTQESRKRNKPRMNKQEPEPASAVKEIHQTVTIQATHYMMQKLEETNNLLKIISNKLAFIVEDLYGTGKKDG